MIGRVRGFGGIFGGGDGGMECIGVKEVVFEVVKRVFFTINVDLQIILYYSYSDWRSQMTQSMMLWPLPG